MFELIWIETKILNFPNVNNCYIVLAMTISPYIHMYVCLNRLNNAMDLVMISVIDTTIFISFTLHLAHSMVGRGNLVLRHSVPHFLPDSGGVACWVAGHSTPERRNGNINLSKYFISSSEERINNQSIYSHTLCPCAMTVLKVQFIVFF